MAEAHPERRRLVPSGVKAPAYLEELAKILGQVPLRRSGKLLA